MFKNQKAVDLIGGAFTTNVSEQGNVLELTLLKRKKNMNIDLKVLRIFLVTKRLGINSLNLLLFRVLLKLLLSVRFSLPPN